MNQGEKAPGIWLVLFLVFFVIVAVSALLLLGRYIGIEEANAYFEELQSEANAGSDENPAALIEEAKKAETEQEERAEAYKPPAKTDARAEQSGGEAAAEAVQETAAETIQESAVSSEKTEQEAAGQETQPAVRTPGKTLDWEALHSQNPDIYAWIYVPDTGVDYPVVQHPTDNSYYLNHNMDGSKGYPGCIYTEDFNRRDFSDIHTVLYGHNLKDKTMFSTLHNFEDPKLFQKEHYIYIYTEDCVFVYRIFAAYEFSAIHLLDNFDYTNEYVYADHLRQIQQAAGNFRQDVEVSATDRIITLSTCTADHDATRRYLVTGVLVSEKGQTGQ